MYSIIAPLRFIHFNGRLFAGMMPPVNNLVRAVIASLKTQSSNGPCVHLNYKARCRRRRRRGSKTTLPDSN